MRPWVMVLLISTAACGGGTGGCLFSIEGPQVSEPAAATSAVPHGDHSPHHGGVVMMNGDVHYEVILDPSGSYQLYFSDATRADLPATTAVRAAITVMRADAPPEGVLLEVDESGESWLGRGNPVSDPATTKARVAYTLRSAEPYWIDLPFAPMAADPDAPDPHKPSTGLRR